MRVAQDVLIMHYETKGVDPRLRGHFEVRAKHAPEVESGYTHDLFRCPSVTWMPTDSAVDHVILYVGPKNNNGKRSSEVIVFIEDKVHLPQVRFAPN